MLEAIRSATRRNAAQRGATRRNAAQALNREADVGEIAIGRHVDFVAVRGDPFQDIRPLEHPGAVIKGGERGK